MTEIKIQSAMKIILHAGDARVKCMESLEAISRFDYVLGEKLIKEASNEITKAHKEQTDAIQDEASGEEESEYSLLFAHAQDTLMTIMSEINITKKMIKVFKSYESRISALEVK